MRKHNVCTYPDMETLYFSYSIQGLLKHRILRVSLAGRAGDGVKERLRSKERELHYLQQLQHQRRKNDELKAVVENKQKEIEQLQIALLETKDKHESGRDGSKVALTSLRHIDCRRQYRITTRLTCTCI